MIWAYPLQDSYTSVVNVIVDVVINENTVFNWLSQKMFFEISYECCIDGVIGTVCHASIKF